MAIVKCKSGHYYDNNKYEVCPYCGSTFDSDYDSSKDTQAVFYRDLNRKENNQLTESYDTGVEENQKTVGRFQKELKNNPTAGWFVCIKGSQCGRSYEVRTGRNFVGRSLKSDIVIPDDNTITREGHCSVVYDSKGKTFYIIPGKGATYLKDKFLDNPSEMKENDEITVGETVLKFVPYCKEGRDWE